METELSQQNQNEDDFILDDNIYKELESRISQKEQRSTDRRMLLAKRIFTAMKERGWKQIDLSRAMDNKDPAIISRWLSGIHSFNADTLWDIGDALGIELIVLDDKVSDNVKPLTNRENVVLEHYVAVNTLIVNVFSKNILNANSDYAVI